MVTKNFVEEFVSWILDDIEVGGSLTFPGGEGPYPAVIFVAGSGPTDRNWNSPLIPGTNGSGALLAQALTEDGFITLRYDKRASGPKAQENVQRMAGKISLQGHLEELAGGMNLLANHPQVDQGHIFVLTNSEGCVHALNYQIQRAGLPFRGMVLTSAFARSTGELARNQIAAQFGSDPDGNLLLSAYDAAIEDFIAGREVQVDEKLPEGLRQIILGITNPVNQLFVRELWVFNPAARLAEVMVPVLIVLGKKDIQVDWQVDGALFEEVAKENDQIRVVYLENSNHVLKYEPKPRSELTAAEAMISYGAEDVALDPGTVETISSWLKAHL